MQDEVSHLSPVDYGLQRLDNLCIVKVFVNQERHIVNQANMDELFAGRGTSAL